MATIEICETEGCNSRSEFFCEGRDEDGEFERMACRQCANDMCENSISQGYDFQARKL